MVHQLSSFKLYKAAMFKENINIIVAVCEINGLTKMQNYSQMYLQTTCIN